MKEKEKPKSFSIEKAMAGGVDSFITALVEGSLKLTMKDIRMYSSLIHEPFVSQEIQEELTLKRFEKGFFAKIIIRAWDKFTGAFSNIWHSKRVRKALQRAQSKGLSDW